MRRIATLLAAAAVVTVALSTAPANAHDGWYSYGWQNNGWREHGWREHEWREHAWRRHLWWEQHHGWYPGAYHGYYAPPPYYAAPASTYNYQ